MMLPIDFDANPLVPAVIQDDSSRDVLMVGFMNRLAFERTQETGFVHFWSRSRNQLWKKGERSGHIQEVVSIAVNCEDNSLLIQVIQAGAVCHTGHRTCFFRQVLPDGSLLETSDPAFDPAEVYGTHPAGISASGDAIIQLWYGAYAYLRDHPLQDLSHTSELLRARMLPFDRVADELAELAATIEGTHRHSGDREQDVILEGSQVFYWLNVIAVGAELAWDTDLAIGQAVGTTSLAAHVPSETNVRLIRSMADTWSRSSAHFGRTGIDRDDLACELARTYLLVARAVSDFSDPLDLIRSDLESLRAKPYLASYFSSADA